MLPEVSIDSIPEHWHPTSELEESEIDAQLRELAEDWWISNNPPAEFADIRALTMEEYVDRVLERAA